MLTRNIGRMLLTGSLLAVAATASAQKDRFEWLGGPFTAQPIARVPFIADAITTIRSAPESRSGVERRFAARIYRDSLGRVRLEVNAAQGGRLVIVDSQPGDGAVDVLEAGTRSFWTAPRYVAQRLVGAVGTVAVPVDTRHVIMFRTDDGPSSLRSPMDCAESTEEEDWSVAVRDNRCVVSRDLGLIVYSRRVVPQLGLVEYHLTNIRRREPPSHLFEAPSDYDRVSSQTGPPLLTLTPGNALDRDRLDAFLSGNESTVR